MAKTTKATKSAEAAVTAAGAAAKDAKRLSKTLPKKDAKKLRSLADEAKDAADPGKKKIARKPAKVEKKALTAVHQLEKATGRIEKKLTRDASADKKARSSKTPPAKDAAPTGKKAPARDDASTLETPTDAPAAVTSPPPAPSPTPLDELSVIQLRNRARSEGRTGFWRLTKAQLVELLSS